MVQQLYPLTTKLKLAAKDLLAQIFEEEINKKLTDAGVSDYITSFNATWDKYACQLGLPLKENSASTYAKKINIQQMLKERYNIRILYDHLDKKFRGEIKQMFAPNLFNLTNNPQNILLGLIQYSSMVILK